MAGAFTTEGRMYRNGYQLTEPIETHSAAGCGSTAKRAAPNSRTNAHATTTCRAAGVPGALAVAFEDLDSLPPAIANKEVVFNCSCPDELSGVRTGIRLKRHGITHLHALLGGLSARRELGFPVETPLSGVALA